MTGEQIRKARKERHLTQAELATAIGTTQSVISELENGGRSNMTLETLQRIAGALEMELIVRLQPAEVAVPAA